MTPAKPPLPDPKTRFALRLSTNVYKRMQRHAKACGISVNSLIEDACKYLASSLDAARRKK